MTTSGQRLVAETLARMDEGWAAFRRLAHAVPGQLLERHLGPDLWTRKEMLAHVGAWHELTVEALRTLVETAEIPAPQDPTDAINARAARGATGRTAGEVLFNIDDTYRHVRHAVSRLTDDQLMAHDGWAAAMIAGNTYGHYAEHLADLTG
jgi:hypothetical protein